MSRRQKIISDAISKNGMYKSKETGDLWVLKRVGKNNPRCRNYVIKHKHPNRNLHIHEYACTVESAVKKILKHEEWSIKCSE